MTDTILVLNAGSSSIKFTLFTRADPLTRAASLCDGAAENLGHTAHLRILGPRGETLVERDLPGAATHDDALRALLDWFESAYAGQRLAAAGHRVVHGGANYTAPVLMDAAVMTGLRALVPLAPLHQPHNLRAIEALTKLHPSLPQVACFDTAFHVTQPAIATLFALPYALTEQGVRRYGFHGLSYEYIASRLPEVLGPDVARGRVVVAHLGAGASMCAMQGGKSVATTMGFTALDGLMMGSRTGSIDPGVLLYLLDARKMSAAEITDLLYRQSGLLGVSGISDDMRTLLASSDPRARTAVDLFVYRIVRELGSLAAALGGLDALIFTAGIGEHAAEIRRRVCEGARWLGVELDEAANARGDICISQSRVSAWVVPTDEDLMIARHATACLKGGTAG
ncbi:MAG: acetate/propionate family kinase [Alphaproteobacteria bacterium]|nr:acetate/propionate family kinase [Alphaproteobacteria bacterium]MBL6937908.1 acetate/propionate family kinase [Alphaproteobacteria bacterium]MBL7099267.1 acetate/propionate family kinase [Alphaproteobacteria bacterium]